MSTQQRPIRRQPNPPVVPTSAPSTSTVFIQNSSPLSYSNIYAPRPSYATSHLYNFTASPSEQSPSSQNSYPASSNHSIPSHHHPQDPGPHVYNTHNAGIYTHVHALPPPPRHLRPTRPLPAVPVSAHVLNQAVQSRTSTQPSSAPASTTAYSRELIPLAQTSHTYYKSGSYGSDSFVSSNMSSLHASTSIRASAVPRIETDVGRALTYPIAISESVPSVPDGGLVRSIIAPSTVTHISAAIAAADGDRNASSNRNFDKPKRKPVPLYEANQSSSALHNRSHMQTSLSLDISSASASTSTASSKTVTRPTLSTLQIPQTTSSSSRQNKKRTSRPSRSHSSLSVQPPSSPALPDAQEYDPRSPKSFRTVLSLTPTATPSLMSRALSRCSSASSLRTLSLTPTPSLFPLPPPTSPNTLMKAWELLEPKLGEIGKIGSSKPQSSFVNEGQDASGDKYGIEVNNREAYLPSSSSGTGVANSDHRTHVRSISHSRSKTKTKSYIPQSRLQTPAPTSNSVQTPPAINEIDTSGLASTSSVSPKSDSQADENPNRLSVPMSVSSASVSFVTAVSSASSISATSTVKINSKNEEKARNESRTRAEDDAGGDIVKASFSKLEPNKGEGMNLSDHTGLELRSSKLLDKHNTSYLENVAVNDVELEEKVVGQAKPYTKVSRSDGREMKLLSIKEEIPCPPLESDPLPLIYNYYDLVPPPVSSYSSNSNPNSATSAACPLTSMFESGILTISLQFKEKLSDFVPKVVELRTLRRTMSTGVEIKKSATRIIAAYNQDAEAADVESEIELINSTSSEVPIIPTEKTEVVGTSDEKSCGLRTYKVYLIPINDDTWEERLSFSLPSFSSTSVTSPTSPPSSSSSSSPSECSVILPVTLFPAPHAPSLPLLLLPALGLKALNGIAAALLPTQVLAELPASVNVLADVFVGLENDEKEQERRLRRSKSSSKHTASAGGTGNSTAQVTHETPTPIDAQTSSPKESEQKDVSLNTTIPSSPPSLTSLRQSEGQPKAIKLGPVSQPHIHSRTNSIHGPRPRPASRGSHTQTLPNATHVSNSGLSTIPGEAGPRSPPPSTPGTPAPISDTAKADLDADVSLKITTDATKSRALASVPENPCRFQKLCLTVTEAGTSTENGDTETADISGKPANSPLIPLQHRSSSSSVNLKTPQTIIEQCHLLPPPSPNRSPQSPDSSRLPAQRQTVLCTLTTQNFGLWTNSLVLGVRDANVTRLIEIAWGVVSEAGKISSERKSRAILNSPLSPKTSYGFSSGLKRLLNDKLENTSQKSEDFKYRSDSTRTATYSIEYDEGMAASQNINKIIYPPEDTSFEHTSIALAPRLPTRGRASTIIAKRPIIGGAVARDSGTVTRTNTLVGPRKPPPKSHSRSNSSNIVINNHDHPTANEM